MEQMTIHKMKKVLRWENNADVALLKQYDEQIEKIESAIPKTGLPKYEDDGFLKNFEGYHKKFGGQRYAILYEYKPTPTNLNSYKHVVIGVLKKKGKKSPKKYEYIWA
jgi:hypothetical protein